MPRSVCQSVGMSVLQKLQKITKNYKTSQNHTKHEKNMPPLFHVYRLSRKLRQYAGASLTESSFFYKENKLEFRYDQLKFY